ncbi:hypothetical protein HJG60_009914 [Phyllostomus discolor]|uniref:Uncharacterized protein n=1 Tax=Phyllostomus discolor TaxID=89673 RepID=A0A834EQG9_9CHIR|nr:hypothetical protein HJG60_009914 [Phyllostomus discolor]
MRTYGILPGRLAHDSCQQKQLYWVFKKFVTDFYEVFLDLIYWYHFLTYNQFISLAQKDFSFKNKQKTPVIQTLNLPFFYLIRTHFICLSSSLCYEPELIYRATSVHMWPFSVVCMHLLGWPKSSFSFFCTMALVVLSYL